MLTPNASLHSRLAKQLRDVCDASVTHHLLLLLTAVCKRVICESAGEANNRVWSRRSWDLYALHQPGMPDEQLPIKKNKMKYIIQTTELDQDQELHLKYQEVSKEEFLIRYLHDPRIIYWEIAEGQTKN